MSRRVSGLSDAHAAHARRVIIKNAHNMVANKGRVHYSQGPDRWMGINRHLTHLRNQYPTRCDCSSTATWMLWDAMARPYGVRDLVNHASWRLAIPERCRTAGRSSVHKRESEGWRLCLLWVAGSGRSRACRHLHWWRLGLLSR
jgi:hypothetical protein